jgi:ABC-2 type transport system ATP-binding protein
MTTPPTDLVVSIRGLQKTYGDHIAVDGLNLDIHRGEVFALLGPNGAGKTTTVEILEGHRKADAGAISVIGDDPRTAGLAWRSRIGIVAQTSKEAPELTVRELVEHYARYYPAPRDPNEVITAVGLDEKRDVRAPKLSGGQRRRLDVALGLIGDPELLFLDEPTTGFDPEARRQFWQLIRDLRTGGTTVLLTTHYLDEAEELADRVGVIARGRLVALDTPAKLGGRSAHIARVTWDDGGITREERTVTPTRLVSELAARYGGEVPGLQIRRPTLEDTYLELIGQDNSKLEADSTSALEPALPVHSEPEGASR